MSIKQNLTVVQATQPQPTEESQERLVCQVQGSDLGGHEVRRDAYVIVLIDCNKRWGTSGGDPITVAVVCELRPVEERELMLVHDANGTASPGIPRRPHDVGLTPGRLHTEPCFMKPLALPLRTG